jgi:hypothetical protein
MSIPSYALKPVLEVLAEVEFIRIFKSGKPSLKRHCSTTFGAVKNRIKSGRSSGKRPIHQGSFKNFLHGKSLSRSRAL